MASRMYSSRMFRSAFPSSVSSRCGRLFFSRKMLILVSSCCVWPLERRITWKPITCFSPKHRLLLFHIFVLFLIFGLCYVQIFVCGLCGFSACGLCGYFACGLCAFLARYSLRSSRALRARRARFASPWPLCHVIGFRVIPHSKYCWTWQHYIIKSIWIKSPNAT